MAALKKKKTIKRKTKKALGLKKNFKLPKKSGIKKTPARKISGRKKIKKIGLKRAPHNPIIAPRLYPWESKATFNPAAFESNGKVHLVYRAIGDNDTSVLGYAASSDGYNMH